MVALRCQYHDPLLLAQTAQTNALYSCINYQYCFVLFIFYINDDVKHEYYCKQ